MMFVVPFLLEEILDINQVQNKSTLSSVEILCKTQRGSDLVLAKMMLDADHYL